MLFLFRWQCIKPVKLFHTSAYYLQVKKKFPLKVVSIQDTAFRLGFQKKTDMYPEYPLEEVPKLWMVTQVSSLRERPYWEKEAMKEMGLYRVNDVCIQVNASQTNEILWTVKHLIKIQPIRFPQGAPSRDDVGFTQLKRNGELVIYKKIKAEPILPEDVIPRPAEEDWKVVDGFRMCRNCKHRRCLKYGMCQKIWRQKGKNNIENLGPRMFNYVDNPLKKKADTPEVK